MKKEIKYEGNGSITNKGIVIYTGYGYQKDYHLYNSD